MKLDSKACCYSSNKLRCHVTGTMVHPKSSTMEVSLVQVVVDINSKDIPIIGSAIISADNCYFYNIGNW